jgi:D-alanyl-D-alanine carboxypeptidase
MMQLSKEELLGQIDQTKHVGFTQLPLECCDEDVHFLRKEVVEAWMRLYEAAKRDGLDLKVISSTRNFDRQKQIWENKWSGRTLTNGRNLAEGNLSAEEKASLILRFSAMPGTSRHHWGSDLDINSLEESYFDEERGKKEYEWLCRNAGKFGFFQPYTSKGTDRNTGYEEEKWHWSFAPVSVPFLEAYKKQIAYTDITGFEGFDTAASLNVIENYVIGIAAPRFLSHI